MVIPVHIICVYDLKSPPAKAVKVMKLLRRYLFHIQDSVFEGPLTPHQFQKLRDEIEPLIDPTIDSVRFFYTYRDSDLYTTPIGDSDDTRYFI